MAPLPLPDRNAAVRPAAYLTALVAIFGGALAVGSALGDGGNDQSPADHSAAGNGMAGMADAGHVEHDAPPRPGRTLPPPMASASPRTACGSSRPPRRGRACASTSRSA